MCGMIMARVGPFFLVACLAGVAAAPARALPLEFRIDLRALDAEDPQAPVFTDFLGAGSFSIDEDLIGPRTRFVPFSRIQDFHLSLDGAFPGAIIDQADLGMVNDPVGLSACFPADLVADCGLQFVNGRPAGFFGGVVVPTKNRDFLFRFGNVVAGGMELDPTANQFNLNTLSFDPVFTSVTVLSGFASVRPIPEPSSWSILGAGAVVLALALRRRRASGRRSAEHGGPAPSAWRVAQPSSES